jgi:hypothetical protein
MAELSRNLTVGNSRVLDIRSGENVYLRAAISVKTRYNYTGTGRGT